VKFQPFIERSTGHKPSQDRSQEDSDPTPDTSIEYNQVARPYTKRQPKSPQSKSRRKWTTEGPCITPSQAWPDMKKHIDLKRQNNKNFSAILSDQ